MSFEERYSRQILFPGIGSEGQGRLAQARVAIVGCGATGSTLAGLLARAGVGTLRIIDRDYVEASNLQRQSLFDEADAAASLPKAAAAARNAEDRRKLRKLPCAVQDFCPGSFSGLGDGLETESAIAERSFINIANIAKYPNICTTNSAIAAMLSLPT